MALSYTCDDLIGQNGAFTLRELPNDKKRNVRAQHFGFDSSNEIGNGRTLARAN